MSLQPCDVPATSHLATWLPVTLLLATLLLAGEVVGYVSLLATVIISLLQLFITAKANGSNIFRSSSSNKCPKRVQVVQSLLIAFTLAWWAAAAITFHVFGQRANAAGFPRSDQRTVVAACSWSSVAMIGLLLAAELFLQSQGSTSSRINVPLQRLQQFQQQRPPNIPGYPAPACLLPLGAPAAAVPYAVPSTAGGSMLPQQYALHSLQQQPQQQIGPDGVVVGIPLIPIPSLGHQAPSPPPTLPPAARLAGVGPGGVQMAVLSGTGGFSSLRPPLPRFISQPALQAPPSAAGIARRTQSAHASASTPVTVVMQPSSGGYTPSGAGNVRVVNTGLNSNLRRTFG